MEKINIKISNIFSQHFGKARTEALTALYNVLRVKDGFELLKKGGYLAISLISSILIVLISITGCSDVPYTGPTLTVGDVDQYLDAIEQDTVCLQDGFDTVCVKLLLDTTEIDAAGIDYTPTVHVHPTNITYVFDYQGNPILEAKRLMDTTQIVQELVATGRAQLPSNLGNFNNDNVDSVPEGWIIQIYYPATFPEANRGRTPETSGLDIRIVEGTTIGTNRRRDLEIIDFTQMDKRDGSRGVQFSVETEAPEITIQVNKLVPGNTAIFHISAENVESDDDTNILQLRPLQ
ncbi:MAG: hypothetical protein OXU51_05720 [Candidatus Poribacteria bacterium]|nr:hypothetical protein [Candidatus Poribacteria bacterium]